MPFYSPAAFRAAGNAAIVAHLSDAVYVTVDLDCFDPAEMSAVGTPEPGGLHWDEVSELLGEVARTPANRRVRSDGAVAVARPALVRAIRGEAAPTASSGWRSDPRSNAMPDGRRRKRERHDRSAATLAGGAESGESSRVPARARRVRNDPQVLPSTTARVTGLLIAVITAFLGVLVVRGAVQDLSGAAEAAQIAAGALLLLLGGAVALLVLIPGRVRDWLHR